MSGNTEIEVAATGLLPETPEGAHHREPSARERMMESIVAKVNRQREEELGHVLPDVGPTLEESTASRPINHGLGEREEDRAYVSPFADDDATEATNSVRSAESTTARQPAEVPVVSPAPNRPTAQELITVNVGGQNLQVTQEQLVHLAQIGMIANQTVAEFQQAQQQPNFYAPQPAAPRQAEPQQPVVDRERVRDTVKRIQYGTEDDAAAAMADLIGSVVARTPAPQQVDPVAIQRGATIEALRQIQLQRDTEVIRAEYAEIMNDPDLADMAARNVVKLRQQLTALGRTASDLEIYREAGNRVLDKMNRPRPGSQIEQPAQVSSGQQQQTASQAPGIVVRPRPSVDARKRDAPRSTSQVIDRRAEVSQGNRAPSGSDIVDMIRRQRGQTSLK